MGSQAESETWTSKITRQTEITFFHPEHTAKNSRTQYGPTIKKKKKRKKLGRLLSLTPGKVPAKTNPRPSLRIYRRVPGLSAIGFAQSQRMCSLVLSSCCPIFIPKFWPWVVLNCSKRKDEGSIRLAGPREWVVINLRQPLTHSMYTTCFGYPPNRGSCETLIMPKMAMFLAEREDEGLGKTEAVACSLSPNTSPCRACKLQLCIYISSRRSQAQSIYALLISVALWHYFSFLLNDNSIITNVLEMAHFASMLVT